MWLGYKIKSHSGKPIFQGQGSFQNKTSKPVTSLSSVYFKKQPLFFECLCQTVIYSSRHHTAGLPKPREIRSALWAPCTTTLIYHCPVSRALQSITNTVLSPRPFPEVFPGSSSTPISAAKAELSEGEWQAEPGPATRTSQQGQLLLCTRWSSTGPTGFTENSRSKAPSRYF